MDIDDGTCYQVYDSGHINMALAGCKLVYAYMFDILDGD
jgi:hypothetical protein